MNLRLGGTTSLRGLASLRASVLVGFVVVWNGVMGASIWLNGGTGRFRSLGAMLVVATACLVTALLASAVPLSRRVRETVVASTRRRWYEPSPFFTIAIVTAALGVGLLCEVIGSW